LWCGCPLVALCGESFAARVSGSILTAAQLPALIATSLEDYESKVLKLTTNRSLLKDVARRVLESRENAPLFDTAAFTRDLESLFLQMQPAKTLLQA
jgi:protein O-GlcNAc transferase